MRTRLTAALALAASGCCEPLDGPLAAGTWGGAPDPISLVVDPDGAAVLALACVSGTAAEPVVAVDGEVHATIVFDPDDWGADDEIDHDPFDVALDGVVCGHRFDATTTSSDPGQLGDQTFTLVLGRGRGLEVPCAL
jgi:hypothetical protein